MRQETSGITPSYFGSGHSFSSEHSSLESVCIVSYNVGICVIGYNGVFNYMNDSVVVRHIIVIVHIFMNIKTWIWMGNFTSMISRFSNQH